MATNFHVGQKVVCVDDAWPVNTWHQKDPLILGAIYEIYRVLDFGTDFGLSIDITARWWNSSRFRPLEERKTSIALFEAILENPRVPIEA